jgi:hypothetical protein
MMVRRPLRSRAEDVRRGAMRQLGFIVGLADPPLPALWALLDRFGLASHLAPARPG